MCQGTYPQYNYTTLPLILSQKLLTTTRSSAWRNPSTAHSKIGCFFFFSKTLSEFPNTPRCVGVTQLFTVLFHGSSKHTNMCKETYKAGNNYSVLHISRMYYNTTYKNQLATDHKFMNAKVLQLGTSCSGAVDSTILFKATYTLLAKLRACAKKIQTSHCITM